MAEAQKSGLHQTIGRVFADQSNASRLFALSGNKVKSPFERVRDQSAAARLVAIKCLRESAENMSWLESDEVSRAFDTEGRLRIAREFYNAAVARCRELDID